MADEYGLIDAELVEQSFQLGDMLFQRESPEFGALGSAVSVPIDAITRLGLNNGRSFS